jgi:thiol-disulfide isomerase/thioredoxin
MIKALLISLNLSLSLVFFGCSTFRDDGISLDAVEKTDDYHGTSIKWHKGSIDSAFALAKAQQKLVFVYWGASWCPACNELRSQLFTSKQFAEGLAGAIPVFLDGDKDYAQSWGEFFQISSYPTMLILDEQKRELLRLSEFISPSQFIETMNSVTTLRLNLAQLIEKAQSQTLSELEWKLLANLSWGEAKNLEVDSDLILAKRLDLLARVPAELTAVRASLAASLLETAVHRSVELNPDLSQRLKSQAGDLIAAMMSDEASIFAARSTLIYQAKPVLEWAFPTDLSKRKLLAEKWLLSMGRLRSDTRSSIDVRLWTHYPSIAIHQLENKDMPLPVSLQNELLKDSRDSLVLLDTPSLKQAVIPGMAYLLASVGLHDEAHSILEKEAENSTAPFYFYASMARVADMRGDQAMRLKYLERATAQVRGRASRVQWAAQLLLIYFGDQAPSVAPARQQQIIRDFYDAVFLMRDGFSGRSYRSVKQVASVLKSARLSAANKELIKSYSFRCNRLAPKEKFRCDDHFSK